MQQSRGAIAIFPVHFAGIPVDMERLDGMIRHPKSIVVNQFPG